MVSRARNVTFDSQETIRRQLRLCYVNICQAAKENDILKYPFELALSRHENFGDAPATACETWVKDDRLHRDDGPAQIERSEKTVCETWWKEGKRHRDGGPAQIERDLATGTVFHEIWFRDGQMHRDDGPAEIWRNRASGAVIAEGWWRNNTKILSRGPIGP